jgi:hypothetical protein
MMARRLGRTSYFTPALARRFCQALAEESVGRRSPWWVAINTVATRLGMEADRATALADECAKAGYVQHDQSQHVKAGRRLTELPHSVTLMPGGQALLGKR